MGWRTQVGGSLTCLLAAGWRRSAGPLLYQFLHAIVVSLVVTVIIWCVLWWPSIFLYLYAHSCQVLDTITGVLTRLHVYLQGKMKWGISADLWLALVSCVRNSFGQGKCLPNFLLRQGGWCVCDEFVCACAHTLARTRCICSIRVWAQASGWDTWIAQKKSRCTATLIHMYSVYVYEAQLDLYIYGGLHLEVGTNCLFHFMLVFHWKKKRRRCEHNTETSNDESNSGGRDSNE
jgi:hypothetical protein